MGADEALTRRLAITWAAKTVLSLACAPLATRYVHAGPRANVCVLASDREIWFNANVDLARMTVDDFRRVFALPRNVVASIDLPIKPSCPGAACDAAEPSGLGADQSGDGAGVQLTGI